MNKILLSAVIIFGCLSCNTHKAKEISSDNYAQFDWFEYQGYDPVYESLEIAENEYLNPILSGFYPDPSIVGVGDDFYLINSTFAYFPAIPIFHSKDLVNWTQIGHVLDRPEQCPFDSIGISRGVFAPAISYHNGTYYVVCTLVDCGGNFVVTAKDPAGPWSNPKFFSFEGIDPSLFFDEDGKVYLVNNGAPEGTPLYQGHRAIWIQEFDPENLEMTGPRKVLVNGGVDISKKPVWIEGPHLYKTKGYYYLCSAEGGTSVDHSQVIFRSKNVWGPYKPWSKNPILTQRQLDPNRPDPVTCTGHMDMVETAAGEWWGVFLGCTPYEGDFYNTGRQTFLLPVNWTDDWPWVLKNDELVPYSHEKPDLPEQDTAPIPLNGNFTLRDDFNDSTLAMLYTFIRTPREKWYTLENSRLNIKARSASIDSVSQPSLIGRRQQHHYGSASASMRFVPVKEGEKAGLVIFQNEHNYYFLGLARKNGQDFIVLEKGSSDGPEEITDTPAETNGGKDLELKIESRGKYYDFYYTVQPGTWTPLATDIDARYLSTNKAGGFVGAIFGLYAYSPD